MVFIGFSGSGSFFKCLMLRLLCDTYFVLQFGFKAKMVVGKN